LDQALLARLLARLDLQRRESVVGLQRRLPEVERAAAEHAAVAQPRQFVEQAERQAVRGGANPRNAEVGIDRRGDQHQLAHLGGKARGIDQRHPAALAEPDQVDRRTQLVDRDIEIGEVAVDGKQPHVGGRGAPVGDEQAAAAIAPQCLDQAVAGRQVRDGGAMQGERRADQGRHALGRAREVAQLHGRHFQPDTVGRRPGKLA
jgi:hypothetical protein